MNGLEAQFFSALGNHSLIVILLAFAGGIISSLLPCAIGMLPVLVGYVGGYSDLSKQMIIRQLLLFIMGISLVLTAFGIAATALGVAFGSFIGGGGYIVAGLLAVLMGLHLLEFIHLPLPQFVTHLPDTKTGKWITPLLLGMAFGAASSPCGTPFLTAILGFMSTEKNFVLGGVSLFAYGVGQSMLLLIVGLFTGLIKHIARLRQVGSVMNTLSGIIFILGGLLLIAQGLGYMPLLG